MNDGLNLADIAAMGNRDNDAWGGGNIVWAIILFAMIYGGNGFFGNRGPASQQDAVTEAGLRNAMNFNDLMNQVGRLNDQNQQQTAQLSNGICDLGYSQLGQFNGIEKTVMQGDDALQAQLAQCRCDNREAASGLRYDMPQGFCQVNKNIDDKFAALEKSRLEARISALETQNQNLFLQSQMQGVLRYPNGFTCDAGTNPFCCKAPATTTPAA